MKILTISPSWIGDTMMSQMLYRSLKMNYTNIKIDVIAPSWSWPLLLRMKEINKAILIPFGHGELKIIERLRLSYKLRKKHYNRAYILPNSFKSALIPFFAGIPHRIGWRGEMRYGLINDMRILNKKDWPLMAERYLALAYEKKLIKKSHDLPKPLLRPEIKVFNSEKLSICNTFNLLLNHQIIGLCPGAAFSIKKCWPYYHYSTLAKKLINEGYKILLFGSRQDYEISNKIYSSLNLKEKSWCFNLVGKTTLDQAIILISICKAIVTNDSGLMHISAALKKPMVVLYGLISSPNFTPPLSDQAKIICLMNSNHYYNAEKDDNKRNYHQSLIDISPYQVLDELNNILLKK